MGPDDLRRTAAALLVSLTLISGCGSGMANSASSRNAASPSTHSAEKGQAEGAIQRDKAPVLERFPQLGNITGVEWATAPLGSPTSDVPGPSDFRVSGVAHLAKEDLLLLQREYDWVPSAQPLGALESIAPLVLKGVAWKASEEFTSVVTGGGYTAAFHLDPDAGVVIFDAVNPEVAAS
ncbi:hypothetical protein [Streptomyces spiramyceticus]|uniref:hypothetical protein n=1 Tax=Streptomyces spiramyceticus TaxID=299717 RepID=UPI00237C47EB|nr:hypothetical protein [Streptomyces spiramyceticus]